jgi:hypothetical protein
VIWKAASFTIQRHLQQIENLVAIAKIIEDKSQLQTLEVNTGIQRCLKEAEMPRDVLAGLSDSGGRIQRWKHAMGGVLMENRIAEVMAAGEGEELLGVVHQYHRLVSYISGSDLRSKIPS